MARSPKSVLTTSIEVEGAVFEAALMLKPDARREFLERFFRDDPEGLANMTALLEVAGESSAFFLEASERRGELADEILADLPGVPVDDGDEPSSTEEIGTRIGPYRLVERIGEGGCGVVYEAEQEHPVRRTVALKVIRLGMDTERVIARFEAERQALAMMDHPNIARVYDAGATANGRPYFVMERVSGERITTYCDREKLDVRSRIGLFIQVCHAIQHAHQKGVIHRDIKPSNVLVSREDPVPKVIDFGIAKATDDREVDLHGPRTAGDQFLGTPPYMSPEQVDMSGRDVDTRTDVYSLGALLYEMLGGRPPFDERALKQAGISEMRRILLQDDPPVLSRMLAALPLEERKQIAECRSVDADRLVAQLRGDLDGIVAKAMAKDRDARYQTVNALAADLGRFLADQPVIARAPGRLYLFGKFVRRNRVVCALGSAVALSLVVGMGASTTMYLRERDALAEQNRLRVEAEAARAVESRLREQAQARANVSQAAVLLSEGRIEEADALLQQKTLETVEPSREAAGVFRELGNWNAFYERWQRAVQYYTLLNQANRLDPPSEIVEGCEVMAISSALLAYGDTEGYDEFRREMLDLYLPARTSHQAEHLLQASLLTQADESIIDRLHDVAAVCEKGASTEIESPYPEWEAFSMALYHHRLGHSKAVLRWGEQCMSYPPETTAASGEARIAATHCLMAMARFRLGERADAEAELLKTRRQITEGRRAALSGKPSIPGEWYTWVIAQLLFDEAHQMIFGKPDETLGRN